MERRDVLSLIGMTAAAGAAMRADTAFAEHGDSVETKPTERGRQTGRVELIISGQRDKPLKRGSDILEVAKAAEFHEENHHKVDVAGSSVTYVPAKLPEDAITTTIMEGVVTHKFTITAVPAGYSGPLAVGAYYCHVDFVEGPDYDEGRWIARIVDETGKVRRVIPGVLVRRIVDLHVDEKERERHAKPSIYVHALAIGAEAKLLTGDLEPFMGWTVIDGDWRPHLAGCARTSYCIPPPE